MPIQLSFSSLNNLWSSKSLRFVVLFLALLAIIGLRIGAMPDSGIVWQDLITIFVGIAIEALPFVVLGVTVSALVDMFVDPVWVMQKLPRNRFFSHAFIGLFGIFMPVCECGNVPVARRLLLQGFSPSQVMVFLLAAPIVNPITFWATWEAFSFDHSVAITRMVAGFVIAVGVGLVISFYRNQEKLIQPLFRLQAAEWESNHITKRWLRGLNTFIHEFVDVFQLLLLGALIAGATQTVIPRSLIEGIGASPFLSIIAMLVLAFVVSICANIDAFFALAYAGTFTLGSIMAFLVFGPMIDMKMLTMLRATFTWKLLAWVTALVGTASIVLGLVINFWR